MALHVLQLSRVLDESIVVLLTYSRVDHSTYYF